MAKPESRTHPQTGDQKTTEFNSRLSAYALAALSAGVALPAVPANAEVVYTPANISINRGLLPIDVNADGINDFILEDKGLNASASKFPLLGGVQLLVGGDTSAGVIPSQHSAAALVSGSVIGSSRTFQNVNQPRLLMAGAHNVYKGSYKIDVYFYGPWTNTQNEYLGLKFQINGQTHYGWARISVKSYEVLRHKLVTECCLARISATLTGYAYETTPGQAIVAGDIGGQETGSQTDSEENTLGALARGAGGRKH